MPASDRARTPSDLQAGIAMVDGIGGRFSEGRSPAYRRVVTEVEARATPYLARFMTASDLAYVLSVTEAGFVTEGDARDLLETLCELHARGADAFGDTPRVDLLTAREALVIERLGTRVGSQLHLGRNRTESLKHYLPKLFFRDALHRQRFALLDLIEALTEQGERHRETVAPVYHHLQHAMVSTLGEYLLSWAASLIPHLDRIAQADERLDLAPAVNNERRELHAVADGVRRRLGFTRAQLLRHQQHATEDQFSEPFFVLTSINVALARLCEDLRLWMTAEFGFFEPHDRDASGSSGLPQKKNPFALQAIIAGAAVSAGRLAAQFSTSIAPSEGLESAFAAASLYQHADDVVGYTVFMAELIRDGEFDAAELEDKAFLGDALMSEATDLLVWEHGVPFRLAHHELGALVRTRRAGLEPPDVAARIGEALGRELPITTDELIAALNSRQIPEHSRMSASISRALDHVRARIAEERERISINPVTAAIDRLLADARARIDEAP